MAEYRRRDRSGLKRAPEEAAIDTWLEDSDVYLSIPDANRLRSSCTDERQKPRTDER